MENSYAVAFGSVRDGFTFVGPFKTIDEAIRWAEHNIRNEAWEACELQKPE
jgi:hypothetical protein